MASPISGRKAKLLVEGEKHFTPGGKQNLAAYRESWALASTFAD